MNQVFSDEYKENTFYAWYKSGRPGWEKVLRKLPPNESGRKPNLLTIRDWAHTEGWTERADALDAEISRQLDTEIIGVRIEQLKKMADLGEKIMQEGYSYIKEKGFDSAAAAVRAVGLGSDMMFKYAAAADYLAKIGSMSNKQLDKEIRRLLNKGDELIDAELEDVDTLEEPDGDGAEDDNE